MPNLTLGPPMIYIPVVRKPWDDPRTCIGGGAVAFVRVEVVTECPLYIEPPPVAQPGFLKGVHDGSM